MINLKKYTMIIIIIWCEKNIFKLIIKLKFDLTSCNLIVDLSAVESRPLDGRWRLATTTGFCSSQL